MAVELRGAWKNTNLYFFTTGIEDACKAAKRKNFRKPQWGQAGREAGFMMWRIEEMLAAPLPEFSSSLYRGDSYVLLHVYPDPKAADEEILTYDVHFWIGEESTEDEYGAAMFKIWELDKLLRDGGKVGAMHREIQDFESELFLSYFPDGITLMDGGIEGTDLQKEDEEGGGEEEEEEANAFPVKLFQVKGRKGHVGLSQVVLARSSLNSGDVFVLDTESVVYCWCGKDSNDAEKAKGNAFARSLSNDAEPRKDIAVLDQDVNDGADQSPDFWDTFPETVKFFGMDVMSQQIRSAEEGGDDEEMENIVPTLFQLRHTMGGMAVGPFFKVSGGGNTKKRRGCIERLMRKTVANVVEGFADEKPPVSDLKSSRIYLIDNGFEVSLWIGKDSHEDLQRQIFPFAMLYIRRFNRPPIMAIHVYREGHESAEWHSFFGPPKEPTKRQKYIKALWENKFFRRALDYVDPEIVDFPERMRLKTEKEKSKAEKDQAKEKERFEKENAKIAKEEEKKARKAELAGIAVARRGSSFGASINPGVERLAEASMTENGGGLGQSFLKQARASIVRESTVRRGSFHPERFTMPPLPQDGSGLGPASVSITQLGRQVSVGGGRTARGSITSGAPPGERRRSSLFGFGGGSTSGGRTSMEPAQNDKPAASSWV